VEFLETSEGGALWFSEDLSVRFEVAEPKAYLSATRRTGHPVSLPKPNPRLLGAAGRPQCALGFDSRLT
jgi:hypothetical protein